MIMVKVEQLQIAGGRRISPWLGAESHLNVLNCAHCGASLVQAYTDTALVLSLLDC